MKEIKAEVANRVCQYDLAASVVVGVADQVGPVELALADTHCTRGVLHGLAVLDHLSQDLSGVRVVVTLKLDTLQLLLELGDSELALLGLERGDLLSLVLALDVSLLASPLAAHFEQMGADSPQRCNKSRSESV